MIAEILGSTWPFAGSMPVVALSFSDLLERLVQSTGEAHWADDDLELGDAYD